MAIRRLGFKVGALWLLGAELMGEEPTVSGSVQGLG